MGMIVSPEGLAPARRQALDELFSDLQDGSAAVGPIRPEERAARRERLGAALAARSLDALICESGPTLDYLAGVRLGRSERLSALVVLADGSHFFVCPAFEEERVGLLVSPPAGPGGPLVTWHEHEYAYAPLAAALAERRVERLAVDPDLRHRFVSGIEEAFGRERVASGAGAVTAVRGIKDAHELELLRRANELTQEAICAVAERLEPGTTSTELAEMVTWAQHRLGLTSIWNLSLIGPAAALPHGDSREITLNSGDAILVDTGGSLHGYQSDNTRSWVQGGQPDGRFQELWHLVRDAQKAAYEALVPGQPCRAPDDAARAVITAGGYGPDYRCFSHRLGHGIGTEGHEGPYLDGGSDALLRPGMCFSNEPGIYLPGDLGIRCEDIVTITADGADHFGRWQAGPASPHP